MFQASLNGVAVQNNSSQNEIWKDVKGFEGVYQVSSAGNVKRVARTTKASNGRLLHLKEKVLKPAKLNSGYLFVQLHDSSGKQHLKTVHRLVAQAFVCNPSNFKLVNHKDENKLNNAANNLEWCDNAYNMTYNGVNKRISNKLKGKAAQNAVAVIDESTGVVYSSKQECANACRLRWNQINDMIDGKLNECKDFKIRKYHKALQAAQYNK